MRQASSKTCSTNKLKKVIGQAIYASGVNVTIMKGYVRYITAWDIRKAESKGRGKWCLVVIEEDWKPKWPSLMTGRERRCESVV